VLPALVDGNYVLTWLALLSCDCCQDPKLVVDAIIDALTDTHPPMWYFPGYGASIMRLLPLMSSGVVDWFKMTSSNIVAKPKPEAFKKYR